MWSSLKKEEEKCIIKDIQDMMKVIIDDTAKACILQVKKEKLLRKPAHFFSHFYQTKR